MNYYIDESTKLELAYELEKIYTHVIFEDNKNTSDFVNSIIHSMDSANKAKVNLETNVSYRLDISNIITKEFLLNNKSLMDDMIEKIAIANSFLQNTGDIIALTLPYFLLKMKIGNDEVSLIINLCIILIKIVLSNISEKKEQQDLQYIKDSLLKIGEDSLSYVRKTKGVSEKLDSYQTCVENIISEL